MTPPTNRDHQKKKKKKMKQQKKDPKPRKPSKKGAKGKRPDKHKKKTKKVAKAKVKGAARPKKPVSIRKQRLPARRNFFRNAGSAWIQFTNEYRPKLKQQYPNKSFGELSTLCSNKWRTMTDEEKQPYEDLFQEKRREVEQQKAALTAHEVAIVNEHARRRRKKRREGPKAALSAYMCFVKQERGNLAKKYPQQAADFRQMGKLLGQLWNEMPPERRQPYEKMAEEDKARYRHERQLFERNLQEQKAAQAAQREAQAAARAQAAATTKKQPQPKK
jgi:hypothetical protein